MDKDQLFIFKNHFWVFCFTVSHEAAIKMADKVESYLKVQVGKDALLSSCMWLLEGLISKTADQMRPLVSACLLM